MASNSITCVGPQGSYGQKQVDTLQSFQPTQTIPPAHHKHDSKDPQSSPDSQASQVWTRTTSNSIDCVIPRGMYDQKQLHPLQKICPNATTISAGPKLVTINLHLPPSAFPNPSSLLSTLPLHVFSPQHKTI